MRDLPGRELAQELIGKSRAEARATPMEDVVAAAGNDGGLDADAAHRLVGRLWALERMFYYIYGGWGQGLETNDFPPSVKYLFSKQIVDESTHEMLYMDVMLKKGFIATQKAAFANPVLRVPGQFRARLLRVLAAQPGDLPAHDPHRRAESRAEVLELA